MELISKRELLEKYGISYGALYRWKRMGLIPEEWFIRKATPAGQETFFNRAQICERMDEIVSRGDASSLQELAESLKGKTGGTLIVKTNYGNKEFDLDDVGSVTVVFKDGRENVLYTEDKKQ